MKRKKKKITAGTDEAGYQSCIKLWPMVEHAKKVFWHHHTLHQQLSLENSLACTKNYMQLLQYLHCYGHKTVDVGDSVKKLLHGILWVPRIKWY